MITRLQILTEPTPMCGAGVHAGVISPFWGGCARMSYESGEQSYFKASKGYYGVSDSIEFSSFSSSLLFLKFKAW